MKNCRIIATCRSARIAVILAFFIGVPVAQSQENSAPGKGVPPELVSLTNQIVGKVPETDRSAVLVLDFKGSDGASSFGGWLADQLSLAIAKSDNTLSVIGRAQLAEALDARHLSRNDTFDAKIKADLAASLGAHTVVTGSFGAADNGIGVTLLVQPILQVGKGVPPSELVRGKIPLTGVVSSNLGVPLASLRPKDGIFTPGAGGVSAVLCISCPRATFPSSAIPTLRKPGDASFTGTVQLMTVVTVDGNVTNVQVIKGLGSDFDAAAVAAVSRWRLKPANDIDGNPVPVHQLIEVTFALN
jgi:TonB family protein